MHRNPCVGAAVGPSCGTVWFYITLHCDSSVGDAGRSRSRSVGTGSAACITHQSDYFAFWLLATPCWQNVHVKMSE